MNKFTVLSFGLLSLAGLGLSSAQANVKLLLDDSNALGMVANSFKLRFDLDGWT